LVLKVCVLNLGRGEVGVRRKIILVFQVMVLLNGSKEKHYSLHSHFARNNYEGYVPAGF
jgi:hypothetical protein